MYPLTRKQLVVLALTLTPALLVSLVMIVMTAQVPPLVHAGPMARPLAALPPETLYQGTEIAALTSHDDAQACSIPVSFTFSFYGANQTQLCTTNNGFVTFDPGGSNVWTNRPLSYTSGGPTTMIAAFWDDLMSYGPKQPVLYRTIGSAPDREFILQWTNYGFFSSQLPMGTFQIILYETSNNIRFQYRQLLSSRSTGDSATVGVRNNSSTYRQYSYNTASLSSTQSILWTWNGSNYDYNASAAYEGVYLYKTTPPPAIPQLAAPANNGMASTNPTLSWLTADRTVTYTLKVADETDTGFNRPLINADAISPTTSYAYTGGNLREGRKYIWAVVASNVEGDTWSDVWKFTAVSKLPVTITLSNLNQTYDGSAKSVTVTTDPPGVSVAVTYNGASTPPINVGSYAVVATANDPLYTGSVTGTLVIAKAVAPVTLQNLNRTYNGSSQVVTYTTTPAGLYADVTYNGSATPPKNVGSYTVVATISDLNYTGQATDTLTIAKVLLDVRAGDKTKYEDTPNPALTWLPSGFVGGETSAVLSGNPDLSTSATTNSPPGTYPITITQGTLAATNYAFNFANGVLTVTPKLVPEITWQTPLPIDYGTALGAAQLNATASYSSTPVAGTFTYTPTTGTVLGAGQQMLSTLFTPSDTGTYAKVGKEVLLVVRQATLTVTADNKSRAYGAINPALTVNYSGFVAGDDVSSLTALPVAVTTATASTPAGVYAITLSSGASDNYKLRYINGALTINKVALTVTANDKTRSYGAANPEFDVTYTGFVVGDTACNLDEQATSATTATASTPVGAYAIVPSGGASNNYTFGPYVNGTLTVTKATLAVMADNKARTDVAPNPPLTWHYGAYQVGDTSAALSGSPALTPGVGDGSFGSPTPLGQYPITIAQGTLTAANYTFVFTNATLTVVPRIVPTITWATPANIVYGTALSTAQLNATATDVTGTVTGTLTYNPPGGEILGAGEHSLLVTFVPDDLLTYYTM